MTTITSTEAIATGGYINLGSPASQDAIGAQTIIAYCKPTASGGGGFGYLFGKTVASGTAGPRLFISHNTNAPQLIFGVNSTSGASLPDKTSTASAVVYGSWQHCIVTWDGAVAHTGIHLYIGATECAYASGTSGVGTIISDAENDVFLANRAGLGREFVGDIAYIARWSRVLDATERDTVITSGPLAVPTGLILCWANDQDYSSNALTATARSTRVTGSTPPNTAMGDAPAGATATLTATTDASVFAGLASVSPLTVLTATLADAVFAGSVGSGAAASLAVTTDDTIFSGTASVAGAVSLILPALKNNAGTVLASESGATVYIYATTGAHVVTKTGQTTNGSGVMVISDAALVAATQYRVVVVLASGAEGMDKVTAA